MKPQRETQGLDSYQLTLITLALLALTVMLWRRKQLDVEDELRIERRRRAQLERDLSKHEAQMDGALSTINRLKGVPDPDADEEEVDDELDPDDDEA